MKTVYAYHIDNAEYGKTPNAIAIDKARRLWLLCLHPCDTKQYKVVRRVSVKESVGWVRKSEREFEGSTGSSAGQAEWLKLVEDSIEEKE